MSDKTPPTPTYPVFSGGLPMAEIARDLNRNEGDAK